MADITYKFSEDFWWGAATSGPQSEGSAGKLHENIFDYWFRIEPEAFFDRVGPQVASDFYHSYKKDLAKIGSIGLNSMRTSIQWSRLIKDFETGEVDEDGAEFYQSMIDEMIKNNIRPVIHLHHFDIPIDLYHKYGGWESKHVVELFVKYAEKCFQLFGDRVKDFITFNEPVVIVEGGYLYQFHYPKIKDGRKAVQVLYNLNLASAKVIEAYRRLGQDGRIGLVLNLTPAYPKSDSPEDVDSAQFVNDFFDNSFLHPAIKGKFPERLVTCLKRDGVFWESSPEEMEIIRKNTIDFLGVNYYQPKRIKSRDVAWNMEQGWMPDKYFQHYEMPGRRMNPYRGWEIYPQAMYDIALRVKKEFNNIPWYVSESGMGVQGEEEYKNSAGIIEDDYRIDFLKEHLAWLHKGIAEGSNCFGYHMWTPIDCWSWTNAYKNRYGFISLDLNTQEKEIKKSGYFIQSVIQNHGF